MTRYCMYYHVESNCCIIEKIQKVVNLHEGLTTIAVSLLLAEDSFTADKSHTLDHSSVKPPVLHTFKPASIEGIKKLILSTQNYTMHS